MPGRTSPSSGRQAPTLGYPPRTWSWAARSCTRQQAKRSHASSSLWYHSELTPPGGMSVLCKAHQRFTQHAKPTAAPSGALQSMQTHSERSCANPISHCPCCVPSAQPRTWANEPSQHSRGAPPARRTAPVRHACNVSGCWVPSSLIHCLTSSAALYILPTPWAQAQPDCALMPACERLRGLSSRLQPTAVTLLRCGETRARRGRRALAATPARACCVSPAGVLLGALARLTRSLQIAQPGPRLAPVSPACRHMDCHCSLAATLAHARTCTPQFPSHSAPPPAQLPAQRRSTPAGSLQLCGGRPVARALQPRAPSLSDLNPA